MSVPIKVPDLGAAVDEVTLVQWLVEEGSEIARGQKIAAVETDKAVVELESVAAGVLLKKCTAEGEDATTGDIIAYLGKPGEPVPETAGSVTKVTQLRSEEHTASTPVGKKQSATSGQDSKPRVSPMVRNLAKQRGVSLEELVGTGAGGVVTRQDVLDAANRAGGGG